MKFAGKLTKLKIQISSEATEAQKDKHPMFPLRYIAWLLMLIYVH